MFKETFDDRHKDLELSNREVLSIDRQAVIQAVLAVCDINKEQRFTVRRGVANVPKDMAMYVLRAHSQKTLKEKGAGPGVHPLQHFQHGYFNI